MAVSDVQWARMYGCVWSDQNLQALFEVDPKKAIDLRRTKLHIGANEPLLDLGWPYDAVANWLSDSTRTPGELEAVIRSGSIPSGENLSAPEFKPPTGKGQPTKLPPGDGAISLPDWTRIYAYIWYQSKTGNPGLRGQFESDPATALPAIVAGIQNMVGYKINYSKLLNLGAPPHIPDKLTDICDADDAKKYSFMPCFCC